MRSTMREHDRQVVADEQQRHAAFGDEAFEQPEHAVLHRHVEGGGRLVRDEQLRLGGEGDRDRHPLALTTRELVRVRCEPRLGEGDLVEGGGNGCPQLGTAQPEMAAQRFGDLAAHPHQRVERGERLLEHDLRDGASERAQVGIPSPTT